MLKHILTQHYSIPIHVSVNIPINFLIKFYKTLYTTI